MINLYCISLNFHRYHLILIIYIVIELMKRIFKELLDIQKTETKKTENRDNFRNFEMFLSHIFILYFYYDESKKLKALQKDDIDSSRISILNTHLNIPSNKRGKVKIHKEQIWILIIISSLLHLIAYFPMERLFREMNVNLNNITGFYILIIIIIEKLILNTKFSYHHILSSIVLLIFTIIGLMTVKIEKKYELSKLIIDLLVYSCYHCIPMALIYNIYSYIHNNYFVSLYSLSGFGAIISLFFTLILEFFIPGKTILTLISEFKLKDYFFYFLIFICMGIQNFLNILILIYFKPCVIAILSSFYPTLKVFIDIVMKDKTSSIKKHLILFIINTCCRWFLILSAFVFCEILILNCCSLNVGIKETIFINDENEKFKKNIDLSIDKPIEQDSVLED